MCYNYWNNFANAWRALPIEVLSNTNPPPPYDKILDWTNPNCIPLMNTPIPEDFSLKYLPEPWWGNDGNHVLNSVVINYNPGSGREAQDFRNAAGLFGNENYQAFVNNEATGENNHFPATNRWHWIRRAIRIFNTLERIGIQLHGHNNLQNHLSIELIPWHTNNSLAIGTYINANLNAIFIHSILFAANESMRIENEKLRNKVILRLSGNMTINLLNSFQEQGICTYHGIIPIRCTQGGRGGYYKFTINQIPEIEFISIWGIRNDFPPNEDMDWIFTHIV